MNQMRKLFATFSKVGEFDGWMIAKLNFCRLSKEDGEDQAGLQKAVVWKQKSRYAILESKDNIWRIQMHLIKPKEQKKQSVSPYGHNKTLDKEPLFGKEVARWRINKKEILDFVISVQDSNPIHRTEHAIVPGFLFAEKLWTDSGIADQIKGWNEFELIFSNPAYEEEKIVLRKEEKTENIVAITKREKKMFRLWECRKIEKKQE